MIRPVENHRPAARSPWGQVLGLILVGILAFTLPLAAQEADDEPMAEEEAMSDEAETMSAKSAR